MLLINLDHGILGKPAAGNREKSGGINLANVAYEHHPFSIGDSQRGTVNATGRPPRSGFTLFN
jgi:hypothetical protein